MRVSEYYMKRKGGKFSLVSYTQVNNHDHQWLCVAQHHILYQIKLKLNFSKKYYVK